MPFLDFLNKNKQKPAESPFFILSKGNAVYIAEAYYYESNATYVEVPRFGWQVLSVAGNVVTIQYQRKNLKLSMILEIDGKYLKKEL